MPGKKWKKISRDITVMDEARVEISLAKWLSSETNDCVLPSKRRMVSYIDQKNIF